MPPDSGEVDELEVEQLVAFAQDYFAADFPNPERRVCPSLPTLQTLAWSGKLPGDELCEHLFGCSECFRAYRAALEAGRAAAPAIAASWRGELRQRLAAAFSFKPAFALAGIVTLLAVFGAVWLARRDGVTPAPPRAAQLQPQPSATISSPVAEEKPLRNVSPSDRANNQTFASPRVRRARAPLLVVEADLDELVAMRDVTANFTKAKVITLRQARVRLKLTLPENSRPGVYHAGIVNAAGRLLLAQRGSSADGLNLGLEFDLRQLAAGSYHLRLARQGATSANYPVKIVASE